MDERSPVFRCATYGLRVLQRRESGPYFAAFSSHIPDMRSFLDMREIVKICSRPPHSFAIEHLSPTGS